MTLPVAGVSEIGGDDLANHHRDGCRDNEPVRDWIVQERRHDLQQCKSAHFRAHELEQVSLSAADARRWGLPRWASDASMSVKSPIVLRVRGCGRGCGRGSV